MCLLDLSKIICRHDSDDVHTMITVVATNGSHTSSNELWKGEAKDLYNFCVSRSGGVWVVDEIRDEETNDFNAHIPYYARNKIITVI